MSSNRGVERDRTGAGVGGGRMAGGSSENGDDRFFGRRPDRRRRTERRYTLAAAARDRARRRKIFYTLTYIVVVLRVLYAPCRRVLIRPRRATISAVFKASLSLFRRVIEVPRSMIITGARIGSRVQGGREEERGLSIPKYVFSKF